MWDRLWRGRRRAAWGVVLLAREPQDLLLTHLAWHLAAGAAEIHLYLDDPDDPAAGPAAALPGVRVTRCDGAFWEAHGGRPAAIVARQTACATLAYGRAGTDWLIHLDADEFVFQRHPLGEELAALPAAVGALVIPVRERVLTEPGPPTLWDGPFRVPQPRARRGHPLLAPLAEVAPAGVIGHALGKSATRSGQAVALHPHFPRPLGGGAEVGRRPSASSLLLHFDGLTALHWLAKMLRRLPRAGAPLPSWLGPHRQAQLAAVAACGRDPARLRALHDRLRVVAEPAPWIAEGLIEALPFDPAPAARAHLGRVPDWSAAAFDAALRARDPDLLAGL